MISNACGGQTRISFLLLCLYLVTTTPKLEVIDHIVMLSGHSHMEVNFMLARIDLASDTLNIYVPSEWVIAASVARKNPYVANLFEQSDINDLEILKNDMKLANLNVNTNGEPVHWKSGKGYWSNSIVQWLQYRKAEPDKIFYRTNYDETKPFSEILVCRKTWKQALPKLIPAYTPKLPIFSKNLDDLLKLCKDYAIPERYHHYYKSLAGDGADDESTFDEDKDDDMEPEEQ